MKHWPVLGAVIFPLNCFMRALSADPYGPNAEGPRKLVDNHQQRVER